MIVKSIPDFALLLTLRLTLACEVHRIFTVMTTTFSMDIVHVPYVKNYITQEK